MFFYFLLFMRLFQILNHAINSLLIAFLAHFARSDCRLSADKAYPIAAAHVPCQSPRFLSALFRLLPRVCQALAAAFLFPSSRQRFSAPRAPILCRVSDPPFPCCLKCFLTVFFVFSKLSLFLRVFLGTFCAVCSSCQCICVCLLAVSAYMVPFQACPIFLLRHFFPFRRLCLSRDSNT